MAYIQELNSLICAYSSGTILKYNNFSESDGDDNIEEIVSITEGIIAASWSPNEEHFLIVQGDGKLALFNTLFDIVSSVNLDDNDETYQPGQELTAENTSIRHAQITWKGDSNIFAVNYSINGGFKCLTRNIRMEVIKGPARADKDTVDPKERNVFSVSERPVSAHVQHHEVVDGQVIKYTVKAMALPFSMMPSGSLIAGFQV